MSLVVNADKPKFRSELIESITALLSINMITIDNVLIRYLFYLFCDVYFAIR